MAEPGADGGLRERGERGQQLVGDPGPRTPGACDDGEVARVPVDRGLGEHAEPADVIRVGVGEEHGLHVALLNGRHCFLPGVGACDSD